MESCLSKLALNANCSNTSAMLPIHLDQSSYRDCWSDTKTTWIQFNVSSTFRNFLRMCLYLSVDLSHYPVIYIYSYNHFYLRVIPLLSFYIILLFAPCVTPTKKFLSLLHLFLHMIGCRCSTAIFYSYGYVSLVYSYSSRPKA